MSGIKTSCAKCIFAKRDSSGMQTGCELGRVENYARKGRTTLDGNSFLINSLCIACRASDQFSITPQAMRKSLEISNTVIINGFDKSFWGCLKKLLKQTLMPTKVIVCIKDIDKNLIEKYKEYQKYFEDKTCSLLLRRFYIEEYTFEQAVNECVAKCNTQFYTVLNPELQLADNYFEKIDILFNDKMEPIVAVISEEDYKDTFATALHFMFGGNDKMSLKEKVLSMPEDRVEKGNIWTESTL